MPFINERLKENQNQLADKKHEREVIKTNASRFLFEPAEVMELLRANIIGQDSAMDAMENMLTVVKADFNSADRPLAVNLFLGSTGVGKTETVRLITQAIHGSSDKLCRIDMNTLAQEHYAAALTGAPPGYVGSKEGNTLFDVDLIKGSFSKPGIVLFDEIEKASREVVRAIMNVLDTGFLTLSAGTKRIDFRNSLIFMTSNIGAKQVAAYREKHQSGWRRFIGVKAEGEKQVIDKALHGHFDPEFLNRIDHILPFNRLDSDWLTALLDVELEKLALRLQKKGVNLIVEQSAKSYLSKSYDRRFGARDVARRLRLELEPLLAREMLTAIGKPDFIVSYSNQQLLISSS